MDPFAARAVNRLIGNPDSAPVLEITLAGPTLRFPDRTLIAVTGADLTPRLDGVEIPAWTTCSITPGATLKFGRHGLACAPI